jgi:hypothetical protein
MPAIGDDADQRKDEAPGTVEEEASSHTGPIDERHHHAAPWTKAATSEPSNERNRSGYQKKYVGAEAVIKKEIRSGLSVLRQE